MDTVPVASHRRKRLPASNPLLKAALGYAAKGWLVLPIHTPTGSGCSCPKHYCTSIGKHPRNHNGLTGASTDEKKIRGWWARWPHANVGIATGVGSGIFVLDVDGDVGQGSLNALQKLLRNSTRRQRKDWSEW